VGQQWEKLRAVVAAESYEGRVVSEGVADNPICRLMIDPTIPCLVLHWRKNPTSLQLRFVLESVIEIIQAEALPSLMGDDGQLLRISPEDQIWISQNWMPRAVLAGLRAAASAVPFSNLGKFSLDPIHISAPQGLAINSFDRVDDAKRWLRDQSRTRLVDPI